MENKQQKLQSVPKLDLTLFLDDLPNESEIGFTGDIQKIRFNWESIENCYGYELPFVTMDSKGNLGAFYLHDYLCVLSVSEKELAGKMLVVPQHLVATLSTKGLNYLPKSTLNKVLNNLPKVPENSLATRIFFSSKAPMLIR